MKKKYEGMSLLEFQERLGAEEACRTHLIQTRQPDGFVCRCGSDRHCYSPARNEFHCYDCDRVTSPKLQHTLGLWVMLHKIRRAMAHRDQQWNLNGRIAADEIFIGGKQSHEQRRERSNKTPFFIAIEEDDLGRPKFLGAREIESAYDGDSLGSAVGEMIPHGSTLKTDGNRKEYVAEFVYRFNRRFWPD